MSRKIIRTRQAREDVLNSAYSLATNASATTASKFFQAIEAAYTQLARMPGMGVLRDYGNPDHADMRMWPVPRFRKYLVFYRATEEELEILRVLHGAQNIEAIFAPPPDE